MTDLLESGSERPPTLAVTSLRLLWLIIVDRNGCSASRRELRVTTCPSRAVTIGSGLVDMIGMSRLGDIIAGISDPCR